MIPTTKLTAAPRCSDQTPMYNEPELFGYRSASLRPAG
jgi:hypothetical protein